MTTLRRFYRKTKIGCLNLWTPCTCLIPMQVCPAHCWLVRNTPWYTWNASNKIMIKVETSRFKFYFSLPMFISEYISTYSNIFYSLCLLLPITISYFHYKIQLFNTSLAILIITYMHTYIESRLGFVQFKREIFYAN